MATVVIGGQASGVGKTGVICALMAAMPERRWTAIKVTQCSHQGGERACDCDLHGKSVAITGHISSGHPRVGVTYYREEHRRMAMTDSYRYLAAGAVRSWWVRTLPGHLGKAMPRIDEEITRGNVVIESNSVMEFLRPDVYAVVVSPDVKDFKPSALRHLNLADAILVAAVSKSGVPDWPDAITNYAGARFSFDVARRASPGFFAFVGRKIDAKRS